MTTVKVSRKGANRVASGHPWIFSSDVLDRADALGAEFVATGHYARRDIDPVTGRYRLRTAADRSKDQSYVLYMLNAAQVAKTLLPVGAMMGVVVLVLSFYNRDVAPHGGFMIGHMQIMWYMVFACMLLLTVGAMAGYFVVPMNALLQHRGHVLMSAGHSIAVQNFNENLGILVMLGVYALLVKFSLPIAWVITIFGVFVMSTMLLVMRRHTSNQRQFDSVSLIPDGSAHHAPAHHPQRPS